MLNVNTENKPAYYAIIPSEVRYCEELKFAERLLYGEITVLAGKEGYCFATNRFFKFIIKKEKQNPEKLTQEEQNQFYNLLEMYARNCYKNDKF